MRGGANGAAQPVRRRWLRRASASTAAALGAGMLGAKIVGELGMFAAALRAAFRS